MSEVKNGRPTVMNEDTVIKLLEAFAIGSSDKEACSHAQIARETYYRHMRDDPDFNDIIERQKNKLPIKAKSVIAKLINDGDPGTTKWYLERVKSREYSTRTELDHTIENPVIKVTIE